MQFQGYSDVIRDADAFGDFINIEKDHYALGRWIEDASNFAGYGHHD